MRQVFMLPRHALRALVLATLASIALVSGEGKAGEPESARDKLAPLKAAEIILPAAAFGRSEQVSEVRRPFDLARLGMEAYGDQDAPESAGAR